MSDNTILDNLDKLTPDAMVIANFDVNQKHSNVCWTNMVKQAEQLTETRHSAEDKAAMYDARMKHLEEEILQIRAGAGENVITKTGAFKYSKVSHNSSYRSNKSVITGALREGVRLTDMGEPVPKSRLEKRIKELI